jgi:adenine-specific DNA-methyltransferase
LLLDPTCGSGTTAYVAEQWGRRWITCDTSRVAIALARTRLMGAKFPYYLLADSEDGWRKEMEAAGKFVTPASSPASSGGVPAASVESGDAPATRSRDGRATFESDIKRGFVYKRVPHVTLKSIANNEEIDAIHAEFAPRIEKALAA